MTGDATTKVWVLRKAYPWGDYGSILVHGMSRAHASFCRTVGARHLLRRPSVRPRFVVCGFRTRADSGVAAHAPIEKIEMLTAGSPHVDRMLTSSGAHLCRGFHVDLSARAEAQRGISSPNTDGRAGAYNARAKMENIATLWVP